MFGVIELIGFGENTVENRKEEIIEIKICTLITTVIYITKMTFSFLKNKMIWSYSITIKKWDKVYVYWFWMISKIH